MALSANTPRDYQLGDIQYYPVKASTKIYEGAAVGLTSGYARGLVDGDYFVGFALEVADNSATATDGYIWVKVATKGRAKLTITSASRRRGAGRGGLWCWVPGHPPPTRTASSSATPCSTAIQ